MVTFVIMMDFVELTVKMLPNSVLKPRFKDIESYSIRAISKTLSYSYIDFCAGIFFQCNNKRFEEVGTVGML